MLQRLKLWRDGLRPADPIFFRLSDAKMAQVCPGDAFLSSYPRSGNTWLRCVLITAIYQQEHLAHKRPDFPWDSVIPDIHADSLRRDHLPITGMQSLIIKSHSSAPAWTHRTVYLFRQPADALVSYARFSGRDSGGPDHFAKRSLMTWRAHVEEALRARDAKPDHVKFASFESMKRDTRSTIGRIADFLGLQISEESLAQAIAENSIDRLRTNEQASEPVRRHGGALFRRGEINSAKDELAAGTLELIERHAGATYRAAQEAEV